MVPVILRIKNLQTVISSGDNFQLADNYLRLCWHIAAEFWECDETNDIKVSQQVKNNYKDTWQSLSEARWKR